jgi:ATP-binding cassette subfamily C protein CydD
LRVAFLSALVLEMVATLSTAIVAVEVGLRLLYGRLSFQPALFVLVLAPEFYLPLRMLGLRFHSAAAAVSAAKRIFEVLAAAPPASGAARPAGHISSGSSAEAPPAAEGIHFKDVSFAYAEGRPALRGVSFEIPARQRTALVGPSGAGKSTVANLLLRFIAPQQGLVRVGERPLQDIAPAAWRSQIAWVPQAPHLFHDTIAANIRLSRPAASDEEMREAARQAHCHDFIASFPEGYATLVGEGGARLSSGQAQRLALARAFLAAAPFLILDEPTSSVDPELEALLQEATERLMQGRMTLVIAHRLNTVYRADRIIVLSEGQVAEVGQHEGLLRQHGLYHQLVMAGLS